MVGEVSAKPFRLVHDIKFIIENYFMWYFFENARTVCYNYLV